MFKERLHLFKLAFQRDIGDLSRLAIFQTVFSPVIGEVRALTYEIECIEKGDVE